MYLASIWSTDECHCQSSPVSGRLGQGQEFGVARAIKIEWNNVLVTIAAWEIITKCSGSEQPFYSLTVVWTNASRRACIGSLTHVQSDVPGTAVLWTLKYMVSSSSLSRRLMLAVSWGASRVCPVEPRHWTVQCAGVGRGAFFTPGVWLPPGSGSVENWYFFSDVAEEVRVNFVLLCWSRQPQTHLDSKK